MAIEISTAGPAASAATPVSSNGPLTQVGPGLGHGAPGHAASVAGPRGNAYGFWERRPEFAAAIADRDQRLEAITTLRENVAAVDEIDSVLANIQSALGGIVKQYPPYGPDAPERIVLLNQISGLQKQLESLVFPPEIEAVQDPTEAVAAVFEDRLPQEIPDEDLASLLEKIELSRQESTQLREKMWADLVEPASPEAEQTALAMSGSVQTGISETGVAVSQQPDVLINLA